MTDEITTVEDLEALPEGTIGRDSRPGKRGVLVEVCGKSANGYTVISYGGELGATSIVWPVTVLYRPDRPVGPDVEALRVAISEAWQSLADDCDVTKHGPDAATYTHEQFIDGMAHLRAAHPSVVSREQVEALVRLLSRAAGEAWRLRHSDEEAREYGRAVEFVQGLPVEEETPAQKLLRDIFTGGEEEK